MHCSLVGEPVAGGAIVAPAESGSAWQERLATAIEQQTAVAERQVNATARNSALLGVLIDEVRGVQQAVQRLSASASSSQGGASTADVDGSTSGSGEEDSEEDGEEDDEGGVASGDKADADEVVDIAMGGVEDELSSDEMASGEEGSEEDAVSVDLGEEELAGCRQMRWLPTVADIPGPLALPPPEGMLAMPPRPRMRTASNKGKGKAPVKK